MSLFAEGTSVPVERSRAEIERLIAKHGALRFVSGWNEHSATIMFEVSGRRVRFDVPIPTKEDFTKTAKGRERAAADQARACENEERRRWRSLSLVIKAKLEAVASGVTAFEDEFLAHFVMPNGETMGAWLAPTLEKVLSSGKLPPMLPAKGST